MTKGNNSNKTNNSRFSRINRELLVFLVFLLVAIAFWFILTFKNVTAISLDYKLKIRGIPNSVIVTSKIPDKVSLRLHGRGFQLLKLILNSSNRELDIDYSSLKDNNKALVINEDVWKKTLNKTLPVGITVNESSLPTIEIFYSNGEHKHVPVKVIGNLKAENEYMIGEVKLQPEFVDIYAPQDSYDTITHINSKSINLTELKDTTELDLTLEPPVGVKCVPNKVKATICVDLQTTKHLNIPIYTINIPQNIILKPFPQNVTVTCQVSASMYDYVKEEQFNAVIDYDKLKKEDSQCDVSLTEIPECVSNVRFSPHKVDYIIEQIFE